MARRNMDQATALRGVRHLAKKCDSDDTLDKRLPMLTESMQDSARPNCCPLCIHVLGWFFQEYLLNGNIGVVEQMRMEYPAFFDASMAILARPRDIAALPELRKQLSVNLRNCPWGSSHRMFRMSNPNYGQGPEDELFMLVEGLSLALRACLEAGPQSTVTRVRPNKSFKNSRGAWPTSMDQLFPFGSPVTVEMLVFWSSLRMSNGPIALLTVMLTVVRPRIYPELTVQPVHAQLVYVLAQMLREDLSNIPDKWEGTVPIPRVRPLRTMKGKALDTAAHFLNILERGPDSVSNDGVPLTVGYEPVFYSAICKAARSLPRDHEGFPILVGHAVELCTKVGVKAEDLDEVFVEFFKDNLKHTGITMVNFVFTHLRRLATQRSCSGPGCSRKMLDEDEAAPFPWCAACKLARYCCRACQRADWRATPHAHKSICELLCRIRATGADPQEEHDKHRTTFIDAGLSNNEQIDLMSWAVSAMMAPEQQGDMHDQLRRMRGPSMCSIDLEGLTLGQAKLAVQTAKVFRGQAEITV